MESSSNKLQEPMTSLQQGQVNLQECFEKFRKEKSELLKHNKYLKKKCKIDRTNHEWKEQLRQRFIDQAKKYIGVPYAKKYHKDGDKFYNAPLYLDCCALIRQIVYDLREDFGFTLCRWNQAYQYDMLPINLTPQTARPGDIIFVSADYNNKKPFSHKIVHVEIFIGGETGEQTIGARWGKGAVQLHDSYKYTSKLYSNNTYYFKSLDTWLEGICQSFCKEHTWRDDRDLWASDKFSIFSTPEEFAQNLQNQEPQEQQHFEDKDNDNKENEAYYNLQQNTQLEEKCQPISTNALNNNLSISKAVFISKGNNQVLLKQYFQKGNWILLEESEAFSPKYYLKWTQMLNEIDFFSFKEGQQVVNHIPNILKLIGQKSALLNTLREYKEVWEINYQDIIPETYQLDVMADEIGFLNSKSQGLWILKPKNRNCGKGIMLIQDIQRFRQEFVQSKRFYLGEFTTNYMLDHAKKEVSQEKAEEQVLKERYGESQQEELSETKYNNLPFQAIIQKYIENPLLLDGKKFDLRIYGLIASTKPYLCLFHHGYLRLCIEDYSIQDMEKYENRFRHLTNAAIQKKHPLFQQLKENTIWSMSHFEEYLKTKMNVTQDQINSIYDNIKKVMTFVFKASQSKIEKKVGFFELFGFDFMLDDNLKVYLLEVNTNPALFLDTIPQKETITKVVYQTLDIVTKLYENPTQVAQIVQNQKDQLNIYEFEPLINEASGFCYLKPFDKNQI